ncbi:DUF3352 domain-containing protein [Nocardioides sp. AN3]
MSEDFNDHVVPDQLVVGDDAGKSRKGWWIGGGALAVLAIGGGAAAWAASSFFSQGSQPAEALPDTTIGYVSIDLDPSGAQKIAALKLARKFPALKDKVGLNADDDIRKTIFDEIAGGSGCKLDFDKDVAPWLGSRAAVAAVGTDKPFPVVVAQANDADKVKDGVAKLEGCGQKAAGSDHIGWALDGDWIVFAETTDQARQVVAEADKGSLADDPDFKKWTDKAGDSGIMTAYAAPAAGQVLAREIGKASGGGAGTSGGGLASSVDPFGMLDACPGLTSGSGSGQRAQAQLADFAGAAATLRVGGDALELEMVGDTKAFGGSSSTGPAKGAPVVSTLPADTAVALGLSLPDGWTDKLSDNLARACGDGADPSTLFAPFSQATGLQLPGDLEKLFGDSVAFSLGSNIDVESLVNGGSPSDLPIALKVRGDEDTIRGVVTKLRKTLGAPDGVFEPVAGDGAVVVGTSRDYAAQVAKGGDLGSSGAYGTVVPQGDKAGSVFYVNFDELDSTIKALASGDEEVTANVAPLKAFAMSSWTAGGDSHALVKLSVD